MPEHIKLALRGEDDPTWCDYPPFGKLILIAVHIDIKILCREPSTSRLYYFIVNASITDSQAILRAQKHLSK